jgi:hypothetical protein
MPARVLENPRPLRPIKVSGRLKLFNISDRLIVPA